MNLFIRSDAPGEVNVEYKFRKNAVRFFDNPAVKVRNLLNSAKWTRRAKLSRQGGFKAGGAGNYNLTTKAIEETLPDCMSQVDDNRFGEKRLSVAIQQGSRGVQPTRPAQMLVRQVAQYWGAGIIELGLGG